MAEAAAAHPGAMSALLKADEAGVQALCDECAQGDVLVPANFNSPGQIVIGGHADAVDRAIALFAERGVRKAVKLAVSVPSHTPLDGDLVFAAATGARALDDPLRDTFQLGHAAAVCLSRAIARAVFLARPMPGDLQLAWVRRFG